MSGWYVHGMQGPGKTPAIGGGGWGGGGREAQLC